MGWEYIDRPEDHYDLSSPVKAQRVVERLIQKMHELAGSVIPNGMPSRAAAEWYITTTNPIFKQGTKDLLIPVEKMTIPPSPGTKPPTTWGTNQPHPFCSNKRSADNDFRILNTEELLELINKIASAEEQMRKE